MQFDGIAGGHARQARLLQVGGDVQQVGVVHAQHGHPRRGKVAQVAIALDHHPGERSADLRELELVLGRGQRDLRILDHLFLHANHQLYLSNLIVASVNKVKGFASLCN